ncbi:hypothetical protein L484_026419 [Morus notabilis]|uniref:F-box domain-containing protein n=1 Tax=Morus notabilis TaxID=981085 RepID=W9QYU0_9ROSA|nr:hypothetical protein L484_026419 [Morus notabilis]
MAVAMVMRMELPWRISFRYGAQSRVTIRVKCSHSSESTMKKSGEMKTMFSHLPEEIVENILIRLPTRSLIRSCKHVCKLWYNLINDSSFAHKQLRFCSNNKEYSSHPSILLNWTPYQRRVDVNRITNELTLFSLYTNSEK